MLPRLAHRRPALHASRGFRIMSVDRVPGVKPANVGTQPSQALNKEAQAGAARLAALVRQQKRSEARAKEEAAEVALQAAAQPESAGAPGGSRLAKFEAALDARIDGQALAKNVVARALRRRSLRLDDAERPLRMLFAGPSGVGKTAMATALCEALLGSCVPQRNFIRFNLSEYSHVSKFNRLTGGDPNYVGYKEGGELTNFVRQAEDRRAKRLSAAPAHTSCVILFDEVDRAADGLLTYLMNFLDQGQLTDGRGEMVDASRAVVLMTTNCGRDAIAAAGAGADGTVGGEAVGGEAAGGEAAGGEAAGGEAAGGEAAAALRARLVEQIRGEVLRDVCDGRWENLGRLGFVVPFLPLSARGRAAVVGRQLGEVARRAEAAEPPARVRCSAALAAHIAARWDDDLGGRSTRDYIEERVVEALAEALDAAAPAAPPATAPAAAAPAPLELLLDAPPPAAAAPGAPARVVARPARPGEGDDVLAGGPPAPGGAHDEEDEADWAAERVAWASKQ